MNRPTIYLDIETTGTDSNAVLDYVVQNIKPRANLTDPKKIAADIEAKTASAWKDTALKGYQGRIACIAVAINDDEPEVMADDVEHDLIIRFARLVRRVMSEHNQRPPALCGFNVMFDIRFIWQRALINRVSLDGVSLYELSKPWDTNNAIDLRYRLSCGDTYASGTLMDWCVALNVDVPGDDMPGSEVPEAWRTDALRPEVMEHCRRDVMRCQAIHSRLRELGL